MNNTEVELLTKEKLLEMYEEVCDQLEDAELRLYYQNSDITELESNVEYWREKYESIT